MIEAGLEFEGSMDRVVAALADLPLPLRPVYFSSEEEVESDKDRIDDQKRFSAFVAKNKSGFFLLGPGVSYNVRVFSRKPSRCDCFIDVAPEIAVQFLKHMSKAQPIFGFACTPEEREQRNRITTQLDVNTIESWVGRDTQKYVPGFYWLTLLPDALAKQHCIPLSAVKAAAREYMELEGDQHLFRFYERPEDWRGTTAVAELCASLPGVFNVEKLKPQLSKAKKYLELRSILREWR